MALRLKSWEHWWSLIFPWGGGVTEINHNRPPPPTLPHRASGRAESMNNQAALLASATSSAFLRELPVEGCRWLPQNYSRKRKGRSSTTQMAKSHQGRGKEDTQVKEKNSKNSRNWIGWSGTIPHQPYEDEKSFSRFKDKERAIFRREAFGIGHTGELILKSPFHCHSPPAQNHRKVPGCCPQILPCLRPGVSK